ncbi:hypothetical protein OH492_05060 [Vibrio chagasii]|nr:hypothetical protein [Vibrio chagasii]
MVNGYVQYDLTDDLTLMGGGEVRNNDGGELVLLGAEYKNSLRVWHDTDKGNQESFGSESGIQTSAWYRSRTRRLPICIQLRQL